MRTIPVFERSKAPNARFLSLSKKSVEVVLGGRNPHEIKQKDAFFICQEETYKCNNVAKKRDYHGPTDRQARS